MDDGNFQERDGGLLVGLGDRYQYQKTLGNKAGRTTVLAEDLETQKLVVIKLLTFSDEFQWEDLRLFEREIQTLRSLDHPAIPQYLDSFEIETNQGKSIALVQNYIPSKSLAEYLEEGRQFVEAEVRELLNALLDILVYLHDRHPPLIHRDIKPSNILLGDRSGNSLGQVYLVDFGSVQTLATRTGQTMTVVGTYGYMPPEQFGGSAVPASDIYSLGCTVLNLITGSHPADLPQRDLQIQFAQFTDLSSSLTAWLQKATHPSLDKRFSQAAIAKQELNHPLEPNHISPSLVSRKPANSSQSFWIFNFLWRSTLLGSVTGGIYCVIFGTGILPIFMFDDPEILQPILSTLRLAVYGSMAGCFFGFLNGLLLTIFTYSRSNKGKYYPCLMGGLGFFGFLASFELIYFFYNVFSSELLSPIGIYSKGLSLNDVISVANSALIAALSTGLSGILLMIFNYFRSNKEKYYSSNKGKYYPYWMGGLGFFGSLAGFRLTYFFNNGLTSDDGRYMGFLFLIAALSMGLIGYTIARWYQKNCE